MLKLVLSAFMFFMIAGSSAIAAPYQWQDASLKISPAKIGAAYITLKNPSDKIDTLTGAKADWAERIEMHQSRTGKSGVMTMEKLASAVLPAHGSLQLQPGGLHLMVFGIKKALQTGQVYTITLTFEKAGALTIPFIVEPLGKATYKMHDHMKM